MLEIFCDTVCNVECVLIMTVLIITFCLHFVYHASCLLNSLMLSIIIFGFCVSFIPVIIIDSSRMSELRLVVDVHVL